MVQILPRHMVTGEKLLPKLQKLFFILIDKESLNLYLTVANLNFHEQNGIIIVDRIASTYNTFSSHACPWTMCVDFLFYHFLFLSKLVMAFVHLRISLVFSVFYKGNSTSSVIQLSGILFSQI